MKILVTGANGLVGHALMSESLRRGMDARGTVRRLHAPLHGCEYRMVGDIDCRTDWEDALTGTSVVVHLAARAHLAKDPANDSLQAFRAVNTEGTLNLAGQAAAAGIRRFVFLSSVKVIGQGRDTPYTENDPPEPRDVYAVSKWEAEQGLRDIAADSGMELVVLRSPLIYGPAVVDNFLRLLRVVDRGWPLPLGCVRNRRSLIYVGNLVDAIVACLGHPAAANKTFLVSDRERISTPDLIRRLAVLLGRPARLLPVPTGLLRMAGLSLGKRRAVARFLGSLTVDAGRIQRELNWLPPFPMDIGLIDTVNWYLSTRDGRQVDSQASFIP